MCELHGPPIFFRLGLFPEEVFGVSGTAVRMLSNMALDGIGVGVGIGIGIGISIRISTGIRSVLLVLSPMCLSHLRITPVTREDLPWFDFQLQPSSPVLLDIYIHILAVAPLHSTASVYGNSSSFCLTSANLGHY